jgi:haloalkane dehalogenase
MKILRTPDSRFEAIADFPFEPRYVEVPSGDGGALRMHYVDEGPPGADVVLMLHGEPSWSYLYRKVIRVISGAGLRSVAPDLIGFGRSDKPAEREDYTYQRHVDWVWAFVEALKLDRIILLCHDWGGLIGLRLCAEHPERFARVIAANTFLPTGDRRPPDAFFEWQRFSQEVPELQVGKIVQTGSARPLSPEIVAAYDAPFPDESYKAGVRKFPLLVPSAPDDPASPANRRAWESLARFEKPFLTAFGDSDVITGGAERWLQKAIPGAAGQPHVMLERAGHFLQEDAGEELARVVVDFAKH